jgi:hypothetical protein
MVSYLLRCVIQRRQKPLELKHNLSLFSAVSLLFINLVNIRIYGHVKGEYIMFDKL